MRHKNLQVTDIDEIKAIIDECRTVRIGAMDDDGMFVVPMNFGVEWSAASGEDESEAQHTLTLWLHSAGRGRKATAFSAHGDEGAPVAIEMDVERGVVGGDHACDYTFSYASLMGNGRIYPVTSGEDKVYGLDLIMEHLAPDAPTAYGPGIIDRTHVWRLEVDEFTVKQR